MKTESSYSTEIQHPTFGVFGMLCAAAALLPALPTFSQAPASQDYVIRTVDAVAENRDIQFTFVNNSGLIVQQYQTPVGAPFPLGLQVAVLQNDVWSLIEVPGAVWAGPSGVNSEGQVALTFARADGIIRMAVWKQGRITDLPSIPGLQYGGNGFNDKGQIAGNAYFPDGSSHGFIGNSQRYEIFDYPGPSPIFTIPWKINDAGILVGEYDVVAELFGTQVHAFLKNGDQLVDLDLPGTDATAAFGINNQGVIVGYYVSGDARHGFIRSKDQWKSFDVPGAVLTWISDINNHGDLVGGYQNSDGINHGFLATPRHKENAPN